MIMPPIGKPNIPMRSKNYRHIEKLRKEGNLPAIMEFVQSLKPNERTLLIAEVVSATIDEEEQKAILEALRQYEEMNPLNGFSVS